MNYGWSHTTPKCIKFFHIAHQKATIFKTTFHMVSGQNLGRDPTAYSAKCIKYIYVYIYKTYIHLIHPYIYVYIYIYLHLEITLSFTKLCDTFQKIF